jgi:hypothetical protein
MTIEFVWIKKTINRYYKRKIFLKKEMSINIDKYLGFLRILTIKIFSLSVKYITCECVRAVLHTKTSSIHRQICQRMKDH